MARAELYYRDWFRPGWAAIRTGLAQLQATVAAVVVAAAAAVGAATVVVVVVVAIVTDLADHLFR
jgi:hypothetical protein